MVWRCRDREEIDRCQAFLPFVNDTLRRQEALRTRTAQEEEAEVHQHLRKLEQ